MNKKKMWKRFFSLDRHHAEGFTLVELIVVIAILAILGGVAVPAYSGYITKANESADLQNLSMLNNMFVVACIANNEDPANVQNVTGKWAEDGSKTLEGLASITWKAGEHPVITEFNRSMGAPITFKSEITKEEILEGILNPDSVFGASVTVDYKGNPIKVSQAIIDAYKNSIWGTLESEDILGLVGNVSDLATTIEDDTFLTMLANPDYLSAAAAALGISPDEYDAKITAMIESEAAKWAEENGITDEDQIEEYKGTIGSKITANNAILVAAKNSKNAGTTIMDLLTEEGGANAKQNIKDAMLGTSATADPATGLTQAALAYGLYNSYMLEKNPDTFDVNEPMDFSTVMNTLETNDFQTYLTEGNGQKDLDGYLAALDAVSSNSSTIGTDVVVNGFDDPAIVDLLKQVMGK